MITETIDWQVFQKNQKSMQPENLQHLLFMININGLQWHDFYAPLSTDIFKMLIK